MHRQIYRLPLFPERSERSDYNYARRNLRFSVRGYSADIDRSVTSGVVPLAGDIPGTVRPFVPHDLAALRVIAGASHKDSRFYFDPHFANSRCMELYQTWIEKSCQGYADTVLVADVEGHPAGFLSCHLSDHGKGRIGLVGVASAWQGVGLGTRLVSESLRWFAGHGVDSVDVVTQGRNVPAQRLYQNCGFRTKSVQLWYHRWFFSKEVT